MKVLERTKALEKPFEYIEGKNWGYGYGYGYGSSYYSRWDSWDRDDYYGSGYYSSGKTKTKTHTTTGTQTKYTFTYTIGSHEFNDVVYESTYADAMYEFFSNHKYVKVEDIIHVIEG